jgi:phytoene/squalene synthetase
MARSITWKDSKQAYFTACLLVDRSLKDDFFRAYAYVRWADDIIDSPGVEESKRHLFTERQRMLVDGLFAGRVFDDLTSEEQLLADLISHERQGDGSLRSFIINMFAIIEFDAFRKGRSVSQDELGWYTASFARSVTDGLQYFIANSYMYPESEDRFMAASAAHITHLLRDTRSDIADGIFNIPLEYLEENDIEPSQLETAAYRDWIRQRVAEARREFIRGKRYLDSLGVLRCKLAGYLYCERFTRILDTIERDGYAIRPSYRRRTASLAALASMAMVMVNVSLRHFLKHR